ncbi:DDE superfamily endonuclease [Phytophthora infestans]|uniref:DDE superfamily endonuclease n=1 Tax=Phytophthora infestans TaxID=4787 RepID=A0A8S9TG53_PHYIN|nr:DDE superfamily endonuclease [Phytophthora infestans]
MAAIMYLHRFRRRYRLSIRHITHRGTKKRIEMEVTCACIESSVVSHIVGSAKFASVFNMDQTAVYIDMNPNTTIDFVGAKHVDVVQGMTENAFRASVFLCASATGDKLPPMIIFAGVVGATVEEEVQQNPLHRHQAILTVQKKAYCDESRILYWIDEPKKHKMDSVRLKLEGECSTEVEFIPPGITGVAQPMDVSVMRVFKKRCRELYVAHHIDNGFSPDPAARRDLITRIVVQAWNEVPAKTIQRGFIRAGIVPFGPRESNGRFGIAKPAQ